MRLCAGKVAHRLSLLGWKVVTHGVPGETASPQPLHPAAQPGQRLASACQLTLWVKMPNSVALALLSSLGSSELVEGQPASCFQLQFVLGVGWEEWPGWSVNKSGIFFVWLGLVADSCTDCTYSTLRARFRHNSKGMVVPGVGQGTSYMAVWQSWAWSYLLKIIEL